MKITDMSHEDLIAFVQAMLDSNAVGGEANANNHVATHKATVARKRAVEREATQKTATPRKTATRKTVAKATNGNKFRITKGTPGERYVVANGAKIKGYTFATWFSGDVKRASIVTGNTLVIVRDGITEAQAQTIVDAWVAKAPKARKTATTVEHADAWVITA